MSEGFPQDKNTIDNRLGSVCTQLKNLLLQDVPTIAARLADSGRDTQLGQIGYTPEEIAQMHTTFTVLSQLSAVFQGQQAIPAAVPIINYVTPFTGWQ